MKRSKSEKSELERRLEEEVRQESQAESGRIDIESAPPEAEVIEEEVTEESPEEPQEEVRDYEAELTELKDQILRSRADFDNYRKRMAREAERTRKLAAESLLRELLPVLDNLDRALDHKDDSGVEALHDGIQMVKKQLHDVLDRSGVKPIPAKGQAFDPNVHEAIAHTPSDEVPQDNVLEEFQPGYLLGDMVLRPSKVVVSSGEAEQPAEDNVKKEKVD